MTSRSSAGALPGMIATPSDNEAPSAVSSSESSAEKASALCTSCRSLLLCAIKEFGDGSGYSTVKYSHPTKIPEHSVCVICTKARALFDAARAHVSFEASLRATPSSEWAWTWTTDAPDPKIYPQFAFPHESLRVFFTASHQGGYGWGIGGFRLYPEGKTPNERSLIIGPLATTEETLGATEEDHSLRSLDFSTALSSGSVGQALKWIDECRTSHSKCGFVYAVDSDRGFKTAWYPDRLIRIENASGVDPKQSNGSPENITARLVLKSSAHDFPPESSSSTIEYMSVSHCWGPPPNPSEPLGGRAASMLVKSNLDAWRASIPMDSLPATPRQAIVAAAALGFSHVWLDSQCIIQDSREDWLSQSAVMGDVYQFAWCNLAILSSESDYDGFIEQRDTRVEVGFHASFAFVLDAGADSIKRNQRGQNLILLLGRATLVWDHATEFTGQNVGTAPLFSRAWVHQERSLARRSIGISKNTVYWTCDECVRSDRSAAGGPGLEQSALRRLQSKALQLAMAPAPDDVGERKRQLQDHIYSFDQFWHSCITSYTMCKLTKHTDKLIALGSVVNSLVGMGLTMRRRYLAGLWDINVPFQLSWITVYGSSTPRRRHLGEDGYVAPSWSWASVDAPVKPRFLLSWGKRTVALADVSSYDVSLATDFAYGMVTGGWLRIVGQLNSVSALTRPKQDRGSGNSKSFSLTDDTTGESLWFTPDTVEGHELQESDAGKLVWLPTTLDFNSHAAECHCLVLVEAEITEAAKPMLPAISDSEKVFRRIGSGNFGRINSMLKQDKLLLRLGTYPDSDNAEQLATDFKRNNDGAQSIVLV